MWWIIILVVVVWMLYSFLKDNNKQADSVAKQGGMRKKYNVLITYILSGRDNCKIFHEDGTSIRVGSISAGGSTLFDITQTFGNVTIQYHSKSLALGNHNLEWEFDEFMDQNKMIEKINHDIGVYMQNVLSKYE